MVRKVPPVSFSVGQKEHTQLRQLDEDKATSYGWTSLDGEAQKIIKGGGQFARFHAKTDRRELRPTLALARATACVEACVCLSGKKKKKQKKKKRKTTLPALSVNLATSGETMLYG
jgi:hypothetical protein